MRDRLKEFQAGNGAKFEAPAGRGSLIYIRLNYDWIFRSNCDNIHNIESVIAKATIFVVDMNSVKSGGNMVQQKTIFERIQSALPHISDAKRSVAEYLLENWQEVAFITAARIARQVGVSESVVVRFCQDLGYGGFPDLQDSLQQILRHRLSGVSDVSMDSQESLSKESKHSSDLINKVFNLTYKNLQAALQSNTNDFFENALNLIFGARRIAVVASRNTAGPAKILSVHLNEVFTNTQFLSPGQDDLFDHLRSMTNQDLLITLGLPAYRRQTVQAAQFAAGRGVPQIAITDSMKSPLSQLAKVTLLTHSKSYSYANSHVSTVFLIDVLVYLITVRGKGEVLKSIDELDQINLRYGLVDID